MLPQRVQIVEAGGPDITVKLIEEAPKAAPPKTATRTRRKTAGR
jgi:hypothetical protein